MWKYRMVVMTEMVKIRLFWNRLDEYHPPWWLNDSFAIFLYCDRIKSCVILMNKCLFADF
jgi:hypothetical protein